MNLSNKKTTKRKAALWLSLPGRATGTQAGAPQRPQRAGKRHGAQFKRPTPRPKAIWRDAFPKQVNNRVTDHTAAERRLYRAEARAFVAECIARGMTCPVVAAIPELRDGRRYGHPISAKLNEVHHKCGRRGKLLRWQPDWIALSNAGHRWVHQNITKARAHGWICPAGQWNEQPNGIL